LPGIIFLWAGGGQLSRTAQGSEQRRRGFPNASRSTDSTGSPLVLPILWPLGALDQSISHEPTTKKVSSMISPEIRVRVCHLYYAEHWKIGTIATDLGLHPDTVSRALNANHPAGSQPLRPSLVDPYIAFIRETLEQHPQLRATRVYQMARDRGYTGSVVSLRRAVTRLRPPRREPFLRLEAFPGEQAQADWASFGHVMVGRARRALSCFVITLSYSRALYLEFFFDQTTENFLRGHVHAFHHWKGQPRVILYDNLKSAVLERRGNQVQFNPQLLELSAHYHFQPRPCQVRAGNQKGRVERAIRYVRDSFWAGRTFTTLAECNRHAGLWRHQVANRRPWPGDDGRTVEQVFAEEQPRLLSCPLHPFDTDRIQTVRSGKTIYVRFDLNDYSIPPEAIGRPLTLVASDTSVRLLDGAQQIASHPRSYDRNQAVLDPAHQDAVLQMKRKAFHSTPGGRLEMLIPETKDLLDRAFALGESAGSQTAQLLKLLDEYGPAAFRRAVCEALERNTPRASSVAFLLRRKPKAPRLALDLSRHPEAQSIDVRPHNLETYDELAHAQDNHDNDDDPES